MKKQWKNPELINLSAKLTKNTNEIECTNCICISKCEVCGGCIGSKLKLENCSYMKNLFIKMCSNLESGGCKLGES